MSVCDTDLRESSPPGDRPAATAQTSWITLTLSLSYHSLTLSLSYHSLPMLSLSHSLPMLSLYHSQPCSNPHSPSSPLITRARTSLVSLEGYWGESPSGKTAQIVQFTYTSLQTRPRTLQWLGKLGHHFKLHTSHNDLDSAKGGCMKSKYWSREDLLNVTCITNN